MRTRPAACRSARDELAVDVLDAAVRLLGCSVEADTPEGTSRSGSWRWRPTAGADDPASHSFRGRTARNAVMFGPPGHLYVYFVYGMHFCANVTCLTDGEPGAVLLRAGEVTSDLAVGVRPAPHGAPRGRDLARGPARLAALLGLGRAHNGLDVTDPRSPVRRARRAAGGPGAGAHGPAGRRGRRARHCPWRFWLAGSPAVSPYRPAGAPGRARVPVGEDRRREHRDAEARGARAAPTSWTSWSGAG